jgi:hypothetical protein
MLNRLQHNITVGVPFFLVTLAATAVCGADPVNIGGHLELFVDDHLIADIQGDVKQQVMQPEPREVVFETGEPWEGNTSGYYTVFEDEGLFRMIYRGWQHDEKMKAAHKEITCYAESKDGVQWTKPKLGIFEWNGSKQNNIVWLGAGTHNFTAFRDSNPAAPAESKYKAFGGIGDYGKGLVPFSSPDCIHWTQTQEKPVISHGAFDSQNLAFWDTDRKQYRAYWRYFSESKVRAIRTATSTDFIHWENEADLTYSEGTPDEHLYTNAVQTYFRAPQLFVGFPTRYEPESQQVEPIFMSSRDGVHFRRYAEPVIPRTAPKDRNHNRSNYMVWGMFQLPNEPGEISVYGTENYYEKTPGRVRRFVYRVDGFVALRAGADGGQITTKPLAIEGKRLLLNYVVKSGGSLTVETLNNAGEVIGKSHPLAGDAIDAPVQWETSPPFSSANWQLRFTMKNADLYSIQID